MDLSIKELYRSLMVDISIFEVDKKYILKRLAAEGVVFLTIELPKISKALLTGLETGHFNRADLTSFRFKDQLLTLFHNLLSAVFDRRTGKLVLNPCGAAIRTIRQACEYVYKLALPYDTKTEKDAKKNFLSNEKDLSGLLHTQEIADFANQLRKDFETYWQEIASAEVHEVLQQFRPRSTSGTFVNSDNMFFVEKQSTVARRFPSDCRGFRGYFKKYPGIKKRPIRLKTGAVHYELKPVLEPNYSELLLVPKDSRGPRTICRESLHRVETQMAYFDFMVSKMTRISKGAINFTNQLVNRQIAEESSVTKKYATLDLKDASDRVSFQLVKTVFKNSPACRWFIEGSRRATHCVVDGHFIKLNKLAGMGSGLTFPTMALLISLTVCRGICNQYRHLKYEDVRKDIFVYGDDICVPVKWASTAMHHLTLMGLKVNVLKSFVHGHFRESCGADFFNGIDVTPARLKLTNAKPTISIPGRITLAKNANAFIQLYEHAKYVYSRGFISTSKYILSVLNSFYTDKFGVGMVPGVYDVNCSLPLLFTKGTKHLDANATSVVYAIFPEQIGGLDDRKIISKNGRTYELDPYAYMGQFLRQSVCANSGAFDNVEHDLLLSRMNASKPSRYGEITVPRKLTFCRQKVSNTFIIESPTLTRSDYMNNYNRAKSRLSAVVLTYVIASSLTTRLQYNFARLLK